MPIMVDVTMSQSEIKKLSDEKLASVAKYLTEFAEWIDEECDRREIWVADDGRLCKRVIEVRVLTLEEDR